MKMYLCVTLLLLSIFSSVASAAVISVTELNDRFEVVIDGSMDPRLAEAQSTRALEGKPVTNVAVDDKQPVADRKTQTDAASGGVRENVADAAGDKPVAYNRGKQTMDYLAKMPKRNDYVEGRLEARQNRWSKRLSGDVHDPTDNIIK